MREFALGSCGCTFMIRCADDETTLLLRTVFGGLIVPTPTALTAIRRYHIERCPDDAAFRVCDGVKAVRLDDVDSLLFHIDKDITIALQRQRRDLFFLHAAAVAWEGRVAVVAASSGTGKSTLTLALLAHGLEYLSDEVAPIDLSCLTVQPYPHALCLKAPPPLPHRLPAGTLEHGGRFHVPVAALPSVTCREALPLAALVFLQRDGERFHGLRAMTAATATARLMVQALNPLAHPGEGLDAAVALSRAVPCYRLDAWDVQAASAAIKAALPAA